MIGSLPPALQLLQKITTVGGESAIDFLTAFSGAFDSYMLECVGVKPSVTDTLCVRFANAGVVDTGAAVYQTANGTGSFGAGTAQHTFAGSIGTVVGANELMVVHNVNDAVNVKTLQAVHITAASHALIGGVYTTAAAVSGLRLFWTAASTFQAGAKFCLYGMRNL